MDKTNLMQLAQDIKSWGKQLGFQDIGITDTQLEEAERYFLSWLKQDFHGEMDWMERHGKKRSRPSELIPGTISIISARMNYYPATATSALDNLEQPDKAYISRYALGRDYHKLMRKRLQKLADQINEAAGEFGYRVFVDSAPVLERAIAEKAGLGWIGKHSNLLQRETGSWFFLGEIYTDLPLPCDTPASNHCGTCTACIDCCPTQAIVEPYKVDARRCISYLTIELRGSIPEEFRPLIGNRIYGCDDCQLFCPWNRFTEATQEQDFESSAQLDDATLIELFAWDEQMFQTRTEGSAIRRIGHECWLRNIAVALGNTSHTNEVIQALKRRQDHPSALVREHVAWAIAQHQKKNSYDMCSTR